MRQNSPVSDLMRGVGRRPTRRASARSLLSPLTVTLRSTNYSSGSLFQRVPPLTALRLYAIGIFLLPARVHVLQYTTPSRCPPRLSSLCFVYSLLCRLYSFRPCLAKTACHARHSAQEPPPTRYSIVTHDDSRRRRHPLLRRYAINPRDSR